MGFELHWNHDGSEISMKMCSIKIVCVWLIHQDYITDSDLRRHILQLSLHRSGMSSQLVGDSLKTRNSVNTRVSVCCWNIGESDTCYLVFQFILNCGLAQPCIDSEGGFKSSWDSWRHWLSLYQEWLGSEQHSQQSGHCESLWKTMLLTLVNPFESPFVSLQSCELGNYKLQKLAKYCESLQKHICENARKLAKTCDIFAKAWDTQTQVFLRKHICKSLQKYMHFALVNPCENKICENLIAKPCERRIYC